MKNNSILFRHIDSDREEWNAANKHFFCTTQRTEIPPGSCVVPRYSCLPGYKELEKDLENLGSRMINSYQEHRFIADIKNYAPVLEGLTPPVYENWYGLSEGQYVVKGTTNSRKNYWKTRMFCQTVADIPKIACSLMDDCLLLEQGIVIRPYVPLVQYGKGINDLPLTNEWRFFILDDKILDAGFYWANEPEIYPGNINTIPAEATRLVQDVIERVRKACSIRFYVVDVAQAEIGGHWIVIELNDGQQSGLPCLDPNSFYEKLKEWLTNDG